METKRLTLIIIFIALTTALSIGGPKIPAPYAPFLYYQLWEIPIVVAFLAMGPKSRRHNNYHKHTYFTSRFSWFPADRADIQLRRCTGNVAGNLYTIQSCHSQMPNRKIKQFSAATL